MKRLGVWLVLIAAFCGVANSAYLTQHEVNGTPLLCNINGLNGCNIVSSSPYSHIFGIPLSEYGLLFYGALFVLAALEIAVFDRVLRRAIQGIALFGLAASIFFTLIQVVVISAVCVYCLASAILALLIFLFSIPIEPVRRSMFDKQPPAPPTRTTTYTTVEKRQFTMPPSA